MRNWMVDPIFGIGESRSIKRIDIYWVDARIEEAKKQYSRCLALNPAHHYARMKLDYLGIE